MCPSVPGKPAAGDGVDASIASAMPSPASTAEPEPIATETPAMRTKRALARGMEERKRLKAEGQEPPSCPDFAKKEVQNKPLSHADSVTNEVQNPIPYPDSVAKEVQRPIPCPNSVAKEVPEPNPCPDAVMKEVPKPIHHPDSVTNQVQKQAIPTPCRSTSRPTTFGRDEEIAAALATFEDSDHELDGTQHYSFEPGF